MNSPRFPFVDNLARDVLRVAIFADCVAASERQSRPIDKASDRSVQALTAVITAQSESFLGLLVVAYLAHKSSDAFQPRLCATFVNACSRQCSFRVFHVCLEEYIKSQECEFDS